MFKLLAVDKDPQDNEIKSVIEKPSFESCLPIIDQELVKRRSKWRLTAISWMDFDDVSQKIRIHIFNKWAQWDPNRPIKPWVNTIITHQITNLVRNNYSSFTKPCMQCSYNQGGDLCELYGKQSSDCPIYKKWAKSKKSAHEIKMPISLHDQSLTNKDGESIVSELKETTSYLDFEGEIKSFHKDIKKHLTSNEWKVYSLLYIDHKTELETAKAMGYKTSEENRDPGYKQIKKIKNKIYKIAKTLISDGGK